MGLGKRKDATSFTPLVKFDARNGKFTRCDRVEVDGNWTTRSVDITDDFEAVVDLPGIEVGWINLTAGSAPDFQMHPLGTDIGERPSDRHKEGFRLRLLLRNGAGDDLRELTSTARVLWNAVDELHDAFLDAPAKHRGKLPVVGIAEVKAAITVNGVNYTPVFEILSWVARPPELAVQKT
jgi:hypothetical protein